MLAPMKSPGGTREHSEFRNRTLFVMAEALECWLRFKLAVSPPTHSSSWSKPYRCSHNDSWYHCELLALMPRESLNFFPRGGWRKYDLKSRKIIEAINWYVTLRIVEAQQIICLGWTSYEQTTPSSAGVGRARCMEKLVWSLRVLEISEYQYSSAVLSALEFI